VADDFLSAVGVAAEPSKPQIEAMIRATVERHACFVGRIAKTTR
jgi:hypothetical protein